MHPFAFLTRRLLPALTFAALLLGLTSSGALAASGAPPGLPGPPPLAGAQLPAAPAPGTVPGPGTVGPPARLPALSAPGLQTGTLQLQGRSVTTTIVCSGGGSASLQAQSVHSGVIARASYRCKAHQGIVKLQLSARNAKTLRGLGSTLGHLALGRSRFSVTLQSHATRVSYWTDGGLECNLYGPYQPYVVDPDFKVTPSVIIDVRPWVAFYRASTGWQWLGTGGLNRSSWYRWTATPVGVGQWFTSTGALNPWTWAPITVPAGRNTYAISAFEVEYWYHHPSYVWRFGPSVLSSGAGVSYCSFP
jgi:hypothetical protein